MQSLERADKSCNAPFLDKILLHLGFFAHPEDS